MGNRSSLRTFHKHHFSKAFFVCVRSFQQHVEGYMETSFKYFILGKIPPPTSKKYRLLVLRPQACSPNMTSSAHKRNPASAIWVSVSFSLKPLFVWNGLHVTPNHYTAGHRAFFSFWPQCSGWYLKSLLQTRWDSWRLALKPTCWPRAT